VSLGSAASGAVCAAKVAMVGERAPRPNGSKATVRCSVRHYPSGSPRGRHQT
jgi:hypothetical protein